MSSKKAYAPSAEEAAKNKAFVERRRAEGKTVYIQRHSLLARVTHGVTAICCLLLIASGLFVFVSPLAELVGPDAVFAFRMSHRVVGAVFVLVPVVSAVCAPKGAWHIFKEDFFTKWDKDDRKWIVLFLPYLFLAKHMHMPDQGQNKSGQRFADGMLLLAGIAMAVTGVVLVLGSTVFELGPVAHAGWLLAHDVGFFVICFFGMMHIFMGSGLWQPYRGCGKLMFGRGRIEESAALYHWGHWARKELESGENVVRE